MGRPILSKSSTIQKAYSLSGIKDKERPALLEYLLPDLPWTVSQLGCRSAMLLCLGARRLWTETSNELGGK